MLFAYERPLCAQKRSFAFEAKGGEPHRGSSPLLTSSREREVIQLIAETYRLPNRVFRNPDRQPDDVDLLRYALSRTGPNAGGAISSRKTSCI